MRFLNHLVIGFLCVVLSSANEPALSNGDRVAFIGDSITHGGSYHSNINLFYATRFPDEHFTSFNCGISGDTSDGANERFESDIARHRPTVAAIMFGMNDAWSWCFGDGEPTPAMLEGRENSFRSYVTEMEDLAESLDRMKCRLILIKPSIYDQTADLEVPALMGKDDQLGRFSDFIDSLANKYGAEVVDFHGPMGELTRRLQKEDPSATIIGPDRVHPGDMGHFVMSYLFLKTLEAPRFVSSIELDASSATITKLVNCRIAPGFDLTADSIAFTCTEGSLPFPVSDGQLGALDWVPFQEELNQQVLRVAGLKAGNYRLEIDGEWIGDFQEDELAKGVGLSAFKATPQYQQALKVKAILDARLVVTSKLRSIAHVRHTMLNKISPPVDEKDREALQVALAAHVEESAGKPWYGYLKKQVAAYLESLLEESDLRLQEKKLMEEVWKVNQVQPHRWILSPVVKGER